MDNNLTSMSGAADRQIDASLGSRLPWRFVGGQPKLNRWKTTRQIPATSPESETFSKDLKRSGFSFVGPTVMYAYMQATGMVNDHLLECFRYREIMREVANAN